MVENCPGAANITGTPTLKLKECPQCGSDIEIFSNELQTECRNCGFTAFNNIISCIKWCAYAKECVGEEVYQQLMGTENK